MSESYDLQADLIPEVRSELGEPTAGFFTDTEITSWLNYGIKLFCRKTHILKSTATKTWAAETSSYALLDSSTGIITDTDTYINPVIEIAEWRGSTSGVIPLHVSLREVLLRDPDRNVSTTKGTPAKLYYSPWEAKIGLDPTPDSAGTLAIYFSYDPALLVLESSKTLDANLNKWWQDLCQYAIYRGKKKDVDHFAPEEAQESYNNFKAAIALAKEDMYRMECPSQIIPFTRDYPELS